MLAHQGGWDEALIGLTPVAIFVVLLRTAFARAARAQDQDQGPDGADRADGPEAGAGRPAGGPTSVGGPPEASGTT